MVIISHHILYLFTDLPLETHSFVSLPNIFTLSVTSWPHPALFGWPRVHVWLLPCSGCLSGLVIAGKSSLHTSAVRVSDLYYFVLLFFFIVFFICCFFFIIICMRLCGGTQISVAVWHLPVCQLSMIRAKQRTADSGQRTLDSGQRTVQRTLDKRHKKKQGRKANAKEDDHGSMSIAQRYIFFCIYLHSRWCRAVKACNLPSKAAKKHKKQILKQLLQLKKSKRAQHEKKKLKCVSTNCTNYQQLRAV